MDSGPRWDFSAAEGQGTGMSQSASDNVYQRRPTIPNNGGSSNASTSSTNRRSPPTTRQSGPRTCRICLETVYPHYPEYGPNIFGISSVSSKPVYVSDDPQQGRLLSPCKCKGSQKYVHEGCLQAWRGANLSSDRNFWHCPTCKFTYRLVRLRWAAMLSSTPARIALTLLTMALGIFLLGYIADPVTDLVFDPMGTIIDTVTDVFTDIDGLRVDYEEPTTWTEHWLKGFFSLGVVGMLQTLLNSPWAWWNLRMGRGRRQGTGQSRLQNINLVFVAVGAFTFAVATWRFVKAMSARLLHRMSERVMDVGEDDDDEGETEETNASA